MNLYKLNENELKDFIHKFNASTYGTVVLVLSYALSLLLTIIFVSTLLLLVLCWNMCSRCIFPIFIVNLFLLFISLIFGTRYYLRELRLFINAQDKIKKQHKSILDIFKRN